MHAPGPSGDTVPGLSQFRLIASEWRHAWRPGVAALFAGSLGYSLYAAVSSLFVEPLQQQFCWSRGDIAMVHSFGLVIAFIAPVIGRMTDRHGVRPILSAGLLLTVPPFLDAAREAAERPSRP